MNKKRWNKSRKSKISCCNFFPKNRRGQFYLIAAIVIISVIIGFTSIANYSKKKSSEKMNDLRDEMQIETAKILEYWVNEHPQVAGRLACINEGKNNLEICPGATNGGLKEVAGIYADYTDVENMYFILADKTDAGRAIVSVYLKSIPTTFSIDAGGEEIVEITPIKEEYTSSNFFTPVGDTITININEVPYTFELKSGMNLYFIISKEGYVATNKI